MGLLYRDSNGNESQIAGMSNPGTWGRNTITKEEVTGATVPAIDSTHTVVSVTVPKTGLYTIEFHSEETGSLVVNVGFMIPIGIPTSSWARTEGVSSGDRFNNSIVRTAYLTEGQVVSLNLYLITQNTVAATSIKASIKLVELYSPE